MFKNVYIYVSDDLRYDYFPKEIKKLGMSFKAVAQAPFSHPSFATMATGVYPETHRVYNKLIDRLQGPSIFDISKFNTGYWAESKYDSLYSIFNQPNRTNIENVEEPFILMERALETHAPFGNLHESVEEFYEEMEDDYDEIRKYYKIGVQKTKEKFFSRLDTLKERGILEDTLVIFTADHGELFDEYGRRGHMLPISPELVYVPLVFINPIFPRKDIKDKVVGLIDILPTIFDILSIYKNAYLEGSSILDSNKDYAFSSCRTFDIKKHFSSFPFSYPLYNAHSCWDNNGNGIVKVEGKLKPIMGSVIDTIYMKESQFDNWKSRKYGEPEEEMNKYLNKYINNSFENIREKWRMNSFIFKKM